MTNMLLYALKAKSEFYDLTFKCKLLFKLAMKSSAVFIARLFL